MSLLNQSQIQLDQTSEVTEKLREQLRDSELQVSLLQNQLQSLQELQSSQITQLTQDNSTLRLELDHQASLHKQEMEKLVSDFDQVCLRLKDRCDQKGLKAKEAKEKAKQAFVKMREQFDQEAESREREVVERHLKEVEGIKQEKDQIIESLRI